MLGLLTVRRLRRPRGTLRFPPIRRWRCGSTRASFQADLWSQSHDAGERLWKASRADSAVADTESQWNTNPDTKLIQVAKGPLAAWRKALLTPQQPASYYRAKGFRYVADVFMSYARADKARVAPLVAAIEAHGWSVWWDSAITPGQEFDRQIESELKN